MKSVNKFHNYINGQRPLFSPSSKRNLCYVLKYSNKKDLWDVFMKKKNLKFRLFDGTVNELGRDSTKMPIYFWKSRIQNI